MPSSATVCMSALLSLLLHHTVAHAQTNTSTIHPPPPLVSVRFVLGHDRVGNYHVDLHAGAAHESCQVPCVLRLPAGPAQIEVTGDVNLTRSIRIPRHQSTVRVRTREEGDSITPRIVGSVIAGVVCETLAAIAWWYVAGFVSTRYLDQALPYAGAIGLTVFGLVFPLAMGATARAQVDEAALDVRDDLTLDGGQPGVPAHRNLMTPPPPPPRVLAGFGFNPGSEAAGATVRLGFSF